MKKADTLQELPKYDTETQVSTWLDNMAQIRLTPAGLPQTL